MSTQLILYPQNYNGYNSTMGVTSSEFVIDGINFTSINASTSATSSSGLDQYLSTTPPAIINTWYRWRSSDGGTPAMPLETGGNLVINSVAPYSISGVYQQLSNLVVGAIYTLTVDMTAANGGFINLKVLNGNTLYGMANAFVTSNVTQQTVNFTAQTTNDIIGILYFKAGASNLTISNISVSATSFSPTQIYTDLQDGQVICDLYQEEDIPLTLSIDDFKNVAEKVQSYSKDFNLPATKRNNRIFNNMFEVTRADEGLIFNPYVKTKCVLKQDGFILFEGYLRMLDAKDKDGEISYNVNLYSEVIALADVLKERTFSDLDFTELTHDYNKSEIKRSWNDGVTAGQLTPIVWTNPSTSGFRTDFNTLKYPFIDWTHQFIIAAAGGTPTEGNPQLPSLETAFRPCIQLKYLIERIFAASGFDFTSNFFNSADFGKLYMDFNWGADNTPSALDTSGEGYLGAVQTATTSFTTILTNNNNFDADLGYSAGTYTALVDNQTYDIEYCYAFNVSANVPWSATFRWVKNLGLATEVIINPTPETGTGSIQNIFGDASWGILSETLDIGDTLTPQFKSSTAATNNFYLNTYGTPFGQNVFGTVGATLVNVSATAVTNNIFLQTLRGETGQWDFLKGIMTMFNLVSMVDETNPENIIIEPYADIFINNTNSLTPTTPSDNSLAARSIQHDWTEKVDVSQMELKPLTDLNKNTIFQFVEDDDDYAFNVYKNSTSGHLYGSKELDASTATNGLPTILQGTKEIIAEPFAATVEKPLMDYLTSFITPAIYAKNDDGTTEGFDNSPRIFYNNGIKSTGASYYIPPQNGGTSSNTTDFLQFSHLSEIPSMSSDKDFVFESVQLITGVGSPPTDNLFSIYWQPYFNELYNADTRTMTLKVNLSPSDVASFKFYDTVFIKNRVFRVNKIEYKPNDLAKVEFILIP